MDFETQDELDSPRKIGGRRRGRVYDEANEELDLQMEQEQAEAALVQHNQRAPRDSLKDVHVAAEGLQMAVRYEVCWTEVSEGRTVTTYSVLVDSLSHFLVQEVIEIAIKALAEQMAEANPRLLQQFDLKETAKWEMRFATRVGLPRYDYPSLEPTQLLNKIANFNKVALVKASGEERKVLEPEEDKVIEPHPHKEVQKGSMSTNDTANDSIPCQRKDSFNVSPEKIKPGFFARLCQALASCFGKKPKGSAPSSPLLSKNVSIASTASEQSIRSPLLEHN